MTLLMPMGAPHRARPGSCLRISTTAAWWRVRVELFYAGACLRVTYLTIELIKQSYKSRITFFILKRHFHVQTASD